MVMGRDLLLLGAFRPLSGSDEGPNSLFCVYVYRTRRKNALVSHPQQSVMDP